jgi:hypothetical protein
MSWSFSRMSFFHGKRGEHSLVVCAPHGGMMRACVSATMPAAFAFASS